jgi:hypothetical protein
MLFKKVADPLIADMTIIDYKTFAMMFSFLKLLYFEELYCLSVDPLENETVTMFPSITADASMNVAPAFLRSLVTDFQHVAFLLRSTSASISI